MPEVTEQQKINNSRLRDYTPIVAGQKYGEVTALRELPRDCPHVKWLCRCSCGKEVVKRAAQMRTRYVSCGCWNKVWGREIGKKRTTHAHTLGHTATPEYDAWLGMKYRCTNHSYEGWHNYGGRGIKVFEGWLNDFQAFYDHIGPRPSNKHSIDRINNDGNYEPGNVRWATLAEQQRNLRKNVWITIKGETKCLSDWAKQYGLQPIRITRRIKELGWTAEQAVTTPTKTTWNRGRKPSNDKRTAENK